ncbi:hypothetical protein L1987_42269 [Smallanthus sonchifolius]|uniref:Uncharacterized protein n=1 Tax=Smallanthus sonchifolius TaxID=185202 RepID=A0ACB9GWR5_9ASTR|nr:hypothetical protein L1987_42269 [Smallanthus sonchifolius]
MKKFGKDNSSKKMKKTLNSSRKHGLATSSKNKRKEREDQSMSDVDVGKTNKKVFVNKGKGKHKDVPADSDSDFETPNFRKCSNVNINQNKRSAQKKKQHPKSKDRLRIRIQPSHLCSLMKDLTEEQITVVGQMGFASIQHLNVITIPSCLGLWLLNKYDHNTNTFNMRNHVVNITRELVRDVLGIPMGAKEVAEMKKITKMNTVNMQFLPSLLPGAEVNMQFLPSLLPSLLQ